MCFKNKKGTQHKRWHVGVGGIDGCGALGDNSDRGKPKDMATLLKA